MGQYYRLSVLNSHKKNYPNGDKVNTYIVSYDYNNGAKLMEFSYIGNMYVNALEHLINDVDGELSGLPVVCCGDYADEEPYPFKGEKVNLFHLARMTRATLSKKENKYKYYRYVVNETKGVFIDLDKVKKDKYGYRIHPLPLLIAEGNGRGGGDYWGKNERRIGSWARNVVVVSNERPDEDMYREVVINFEDKYC